MPVQRVPYITALAALTSAAPLSAWACPEALCGLAVVAPAHAAHVPANAPGIGLTGSSVDKVLATELFASDGGSVPLQKLSFGADPLVGGSSGLALFDAPLDVGASYTIRRTLGCLRLAGEQTVASSFTVDPPAPFPTSVGQASATYQVLPIVVRTIYGGLPGTSTGVSAIAAQLSLEVSPELVPYLAVTRFVTFVDDVVWASSAYGQPFARRDGSDVVSLKDVTRPYAVCGVLPPEAQCGVFALRSGNHRVRIEAQIAGAQVAPPSVELDIALPCPTADAGAADDAMAVDASSSSDNDSPLVEDGRATSDRATEVNDGAQDAIADASVDVVPPGPASDAEAPTNVPGPSDTIGGGACGVVAGASSLPTWPALVVCAMLLETRRRRRSRRLSRHGS